jgi:hypothetical protein
MALWADSPDDETLAAWFPEDEATLMEAEDWYREEVATQQLQQRDHMREALPEAPASANTHITLAGRQVQVTLRDTDEGRLLARLEALLNRYPVDAAPVSPCPAPAARTPTPEGWCVVHAVQMKRQQNERGHWWSHKTSEGGWCKGH